MKCPNCSSSLISVKVTKHDTNDTILRYRTCRSCAHKWFTVEAQCEATFIYRKRPRGQRPLLISRQAFTPDEQVANEAITVAAVTTKRSTAIKETQRHDPITLQAAS